MRHITFNLTLVLLIVTIASCKKTDKPSTPVIPNPPDTIAVTPMAIDVPANMYIVGTAAGPGFFNTTLWNNGKAITLNDSIAPIYPTSVYASGGNIYVTGFERIPNSNYTIAKYFKNGAVTNLTDSLHFGMASSVFVSGDDVYIAVGDGTSLNNVVKYWKNGVSVPLIDAPIPGSANSIFVVNNDVYVAGFENVHPMQQPHYSAVYWKNGNRIILSNDSVESTVATSVFVSGNDVYVAGDAYTGTHIEAVYWKNGQRVILSPNDPHDEHTTAIGVSGNDVYVSGYADYVAKYWKNGSSVNLTDGKNDGRASSLSIAHGDVYIAGYEDDIPKYWKNGVAHIIQKETGEQAGAAFGVFVTE